MRVAEDLGHSRVVQHGLILVKYRSKELIRETSCVNRQPSHSLCVNTARHLELLTVSFVLTLGPSQPTRGLCPSPSAGGTGDTPEAGAPCLQHLSTPALSHSRVTGVNTGEQLVWCGAVRPAVRPDGQRPELPTDQQLWGRYEGDHLSAYLVRRHVPACCYRISP